MGRLIRSSEFDGANNLIQRIEQLYDKANRLEKQSWVIDGDSYSESYTYNDPAVGADASVRPKDGSLASVTTATGDTIEFSYDSLKRLNETNIKNSAGNTIYRTGYIYKAGTEANQTTAQIRGFTVWNPDYTNIVSTRYEYDVLGNITRIEDGTGAARTLAEYTYDELNQLTQEKIYNYNSNGTYTSTDTYVYTYDSAGNILTEKKNGAVVNAYTYSTGPWADQLVAVNGEEITYDGSGNPEMYYSANGIDYDFYWTEGRQLAGLEGWGEVPFRAEYEYDADGIRVAKSTETITGIYSDHAYVTQNGKVMRETIGTGTTAKVLDFVYDNSGKPFALIYTNGTATPQTYYYVLNLQGDVVALMTAERTIVARYTYNAWGEILSATGTMAEINPIRYRGYYYDTETGFYYLQSRYYDPANHRFINADGYTSTGQGFLGHNMFAYCRNAPVNRCDYSGTYDRDKAVEYALQWGESINNAYPNMTAIGGDCTNFVSQCLSAGGIPQTEDWYCKKRTWFGRGVTLSFISIYSHRAWKFSEIWTRADDNFKYVKENHMNGKPIKITDDSQIQRFLDVYNIQVGDLLYWSNESGIHHAAIITDICDGEIYYAAHSGANTKRSLYGKIGSETVYIVMIKDDKI